MEYPRQSQRESSSGGPGWMLFCIAIAIALALAALPWIILGFLAQRFTQRLGWHWKASFLFWLALFFAGGFLLYNSYYHGILQALVQREWIDYVLAAKHYQTDFAHYPLRQLWAETWPVWLHTWPAIGIVGLAGELQTNRRQDTAKVLRQEERRRQNRIERSQRQARKRTSRPTHVPDEIKGQMVIGVAIHDEEG